MRYTHAGEVTNLGRLPEVRFREARIPEARFPRIIRLGSPVSENNPCRKSGFREQPLSEARWTEPTILLNAGSCAEPLLSFRGIIPGWWFEPLKAKRGRERTVRKRRARQLEHPPFGRQVAFARVATGLGWTSLGALAVGASAAGAVAIGALAIRALAVRRARIKHLNIEELEVGRLHVRELVVEQEQTPQSRGQDSGGA